MVSIHGFLVLWLSAYGGLSGFFIPYPFDSPGRLARASSILVLYPFVAGGGLDD